MFLGSEVNFPPKGSDRNYNLTFSRETTLPRNLRSYLPDSKVILPTNEVYFDDKFTGTPAATHYTCLGPGKKGSTLISLNREPEMTSFLTKPVFFHSKRVFPPEGSIGNPIFAFSRVFR